MTPPFDYRSCRFCPRSCGADRTVTYGYCQSPAHAVAARAALHHWEEPCISGVRGSGTVFFSGCTLRCCFCQNYKISAEGFGKPVTAERLQDIFLELQNAGAHNINLVTATQYLPTVLEALEVAKTGTNGKPRLTVPVVYNCGGYETPEAIRALAPFVDIWLPDLKYHSRELSARYSGAPDYFEKASAAIREMIRLTGVPIFTTERVSPDSAAETPPDSAQCRLMKRGVIIRHMVLPGQREDSIRLLHWMHDELPKGHFLVSLLSQYTPFYHSSQFPELNRRITSYEYQKVVDAALSLGLTDGYMQEKSSAKEEYTPPFGLEGI